MSARERFEAWRDGVGYEFFGINPKGVMDRAYEFGVKAAKAEAAEERAELVAEVERLREALKTCPYRGHWWVDVALPSLAATDAEGE